MPDKYQLFCFTYAGGTANFFDIIEPDFSGIEVIKLEYSGHGKRYKECLYDDFDNLTDDLFIELQKKVKGKYALFGYSMGSIAAFTILKKIISSRFPQPEHIFISAHEPRAWTEVTEHFGEDFDEWVKKRTISFGAVPKSIINNSVFWRTYLPIFRSDYTIIGKVDFDKPLLQTSIPATFFYSEEDTSFEEMVKWERYFVGECNYYRFEGNHFFIKEHHKEMAKIICKKLGVEANVF